MLSPDMRSASFMELALFNFPVETAESRPRRPVGELLVMLRHPTFHLIVTL